MKDFERCWVFQSKNSFKKLSKDDSDKDNVKFMTESTIEAVDFDEAKRRYTNALGLSYTSMASVDALLRKDGIPVFIEFKNGKVPSAEVKTKIRDSMLLYCDVTGTRLCDARETAEFLLVYNAGENSYWASLLHIEDHFLKKAGKERIGFDLDRFKGLYFRDVHTYSKEEFEQFLLNYSQ